MVHPVHEHAEVANASALAWSRTNKKISIVRNEAFDLGAVYPIEVTVKGEPRIQYVKRILEAVLKLGAFTLDGEIVEIDGFLLKNIEHWTERSTPAPEEILDLLSERCAVKCEFCYLRMNPDEGITKFNPNVSESNIRDIELRLDLMKRGRRLFSPTFELEEILGNRNFKAVARELRALTDDPFYISTTGSSLNEEMIDFLASIEPIELRISLNSANPAERFRVMRDKKSVVLTALKSLHKRNMRFSVSLVMWPNLSWKDLEETVRFADECKPYAIIAILPGYTRAFSDAALFDTEEYWQETVKKIASLRFEVDTPLIAHPRLYEENVLGYPPNVPLVIGVLPRSPAACAGLRIGDILVGIDDFNPVYGRRQLDSLLVLKHRQMVETVTFHIQRGRESLSLKLDVAGAYAAGYPYKPPFSAQFGVQLISQGIAISDLRELGRLATKHNAKIVGIATSDIVLPSLLDMIKSWKETLFAGIEIVPFIPENSFFGGNIRLGELCTASDYVAAIRELKRQRKDVGLIVIPSPAFGPGGWWRDLAGVPFIRIEREVGIPVELLVCASFE